MTTIYDIGVRFHITGNLETELRTALQQMEGVDREAQRVVRTLDRINLRGLRSEIATARRELAGLAGAGSGQSRFAQWAKDLTPSARDMGAMSRAAGTLEGRVDRITRSLSQWPDKISAAAHALDRMRTSAPHSSSFSGRGGGGGGGRNGGGGYDAPVRPRGHRHIEEPRSHVGQGLAGAVGVGAGTHTLQSVILQGASSNREDLRAKNAGLTPEQNETLRKAATDIVSKYPSLSRLSVREQGRLLIPNVGDFDTAMAVLPEYIKGQVALQVTAGPQGGQKDMENFARFVDIIGRSMSMDDTAKLIDSFVRFRQLDAEAIKSSDFVNAAQSAGTAGKSLSVGFWGTVAPALFSQQKGARTGTDLASAYQNTAIGRATDSAVIAQEKAGWREGFEAKTGKDGKLKIINKGQLVDGALYGSNPFEWAKKHVIPDMVRKGLLPEGFARGDYSQDLTDVQRSGGAKYLSERFSNRRGANIFTMMVQDIEQIDKIIQQRNKARGTADILSDQKSDVYTGAEAVKAQASGAASALSAPSMDKLAAALDRVTTGLSKTADFLERNPVAAQSAFAGGASVVGGAVAAGAAALTIAAVAQLTLPALAIGSIAALTIGTFLFPWEELYKKMGWTPGLALGGKNDNIPNKNMIGALPGLTAEPDKADADYAEKMRRRKAAIEGLGISAATTEAAQARLAETTGRIPAAAVPAASAIDRLGDAIKGFLQKMGEGLAAGASNINFEGGGGVGGLIHKASLGGANDNIGGSGVGRALGRGGGSGGTMPAIPSSVQMTDAERNTLGLIMKHESHGQNTLNYMGKRQGLNPQTAKGYTAQGYFQMLNSNWRRIAPGLGITAPNAMSGSLEDQTRVALHLLRNGGIGNWSKYNPALRGALGRGERVQPGASAPPPTAGPPPHSRKPIETTVHVNLGNRRFATVVASAMADEVRHPRSAGRMDTHGTWSPPSHQGSDAA